MWGGRLGPGRRRGCGAGLRRGRVPRLRGSDALGPVRAGAGGGAPLGARVALSRPSGGFAPDLESRRRECGPDRPAHGLRLDLRLPWQAAASSGFRPADPVETDVRRGGERRPRRDEPMGWRPPARARLPLDGSDAGHHCRGVLASCRAGRFARSAALPAKRAGLSRFHSEQGKKARVPRAGSPRNAPASLSRRAPLPERRTAQAPLGWAKA